jgi:hypothetical protein
MIQGFHSGELSYAAAMRLVYEKQEREAHDKQLLLGFVNYLYDESMKQGIDRNDACVLIGRFLGMRKGYDFLKRVDPAPRVPDAQLTRFYRHVKVPPFFVKTEPVRLEDYVDYANGFLSPACGFCEVEPSVEHCTNCDVFLRQI